MDIKSKVRLIKKGTVEPKENVKIEMIAKPEDKTDVKFAVFRNVFQIVQGLPTIQRNRCLVCSGRMDVIQKAQEYWNKLSDKERSLCSVEAIAYEGGCGQRSKSMTLWDSMMGFNKRALTKEEMAYIRK